jgi:transposase
LIRARDLLIRLRTAAVNAVRGLTKSCGHWMPASSTRCFAKHGLAVMPPRLQQALGPVLQQIAEMTLKIKQYDRQIQLLTQTEYPETQDFGLQDRPINGSIDSPLEPQSAPSSLRISSSECE